MTFRGSFATPLPFSGLVNPLGVIVDRAGNVYVADSRDFASVRRVLKLNAR
jgi:hypothetical protein